MRASSHYYYPPWTFLIFAIPISYCGYESDDHHQNNGHERPELTGLYPGPYFDLERNHENISSHVGTHAYLPCFVKQLGNKSVSWIRKSDAHIVTVDRFTFIADERFQVLPLGESWTLQIKYVQPRDAGFYECQISTEPKLAYRIQLNVLVPTIRMDTTEENMFVWEGSQVQLRCVVQYTQTENLDKILWAKNGEAIDKRDPSKLIVFHGKIDGSAIVETATFSTVHKSDGGNYTCSLPNVGAATVALHVLSGENPASLHHGRGLQSGPVTSEGSTMHLRTAFSNTVYLCVGFCLLFESIRWMCHWDWDKQS